MWPDPSKSIPWGLGSIEPSEMLYEYDGPAIFSANIGLAQYIFYKFREGERTAYFLVSGVNDASVRALSAGNLSIRGALGRPQWIIEIGSGMKGERYWKIAPEEIPENVFPRAGLSLLPNRSQVPNLLEQASSFFSLRFAGRRFVGDSIPLARFKTLMDSACDSFRRIFPAPVVDQHRIGHAFDLEIAQPKFSSLIISVKGYSIDRTRIRKSILEKLNQHEINKSILEKRDTFFSEVETVVNQVRRVELSRGFAVEHFDVLYQIADIVPRNEEDVELVEFATGEERAITPVSINYEQGKRLHSAYRLAEASERSISGVVVEINDDSSTFVIRDRNHRQATCVVESDTFRDLEFSIGSQVAVRGEFIRRHRRDKIYVRGRPQFGP